jgi:hypothetical protein
MKEGLSCSGEFLTNAASNLQAHSPYLHISTEHLCDATLSCSGLVLKKFSGGTILYGKCQSGPNSHTNLTVFLALNLGQKRTWSFQDEECGRLPAGRRVRAGPPGDESEADLIISR